MGRWVGARAIVGFVVGTIALTTTAGCGSAGCPDTGGPAVILDSSAIKARWPTSDITLCADTRCERRRVDLSVPLSTPPIAPESIALRVVVAGKTVATSRLADVPLQHPRCGPPYIQLSTDTDGRLVRP